MRRSWKVGARVKIDRVNGGTVAGQVWADGPRDGEVWVALEIGAFVLVQKKTRVAYVETTNSNPYGKVA